jgi:hypothetical protein
VLDELADEKSSENFWVTKNGSGDYLFDGSIVKIKSKTGQYFKIFDATFSLKPKGGDIPYNEIISECKKRRLTVDKDKILRALSGKSANFFHHVKGIKQSTAYGISLFQAPPKGKYLEFNNIKK